MALNVAARIECGHVKVGDNVLVMPAAEEVVVKSKLVCVSVLVCACVGSGINGKICDLALMVSDELRTWAVAGEQVVIAVQGIDIAKLK